jgi:hypothetical protein
MATLGQFRFAPSGRVSGIGLEVALKLAELRGYRADLVSVLLQEAESTIIASINSTTDDPI